MLIDHRIYLDDLKAGHSAVVSDDFHGQVSFPITGAAAYRRAYTGGVFRIDPIHIERNVVAGGAASGHAQRFFNHRAHTALVDVTHGVDLDPGLLDVLFFPHVHVAHTDQDAVFGMYFGGEPID